MKSNFITGNRLQETANQLLESKYSSNLENFEKNSFVKQNCAMFGFWKILFNSSLVKSSSLESWIHLLLNLDSSSCLFFNLDLELVDSILTSFFWACFYNDHSKPGLWSVVLPPPSTMLLLGWVWGSYGGHRQMVFLVVSEFYSHWQIIYPIFSMLVAN